MASSPKEGLATQLCRARDAVATLKIPYETTEDRGKFLELTVAGKNLIRSFIPTEPSPLADLMGAVTKAVENPIGGKKLSELLAGARKVAIITENQFRAAPTTQIVPWLLTQIRRAGATPVIVIGCGKMAVLAPDAIERKFGSEVVGSGVEIYCNDVKQRDNYVFEGTTSSGVAVWVHRKVAEADVILTISTTQATLWGYGGSGMIIPGVAGNETIEYNHVMSLAPDCRPGNNDCRMQQDKYEAARIAGVSMGIHLLVNNASQPTYVNAGDFVVAHQEAVRAYERTYRFAAPEFQKQKADIVIAGCSAPTGDLFTHTCWAVVNCLPIVKQGGTIIFATPCRGYRTWPGFALMDFMKPFLPASPEKQELALKSFYDQSNGLWTGCVWYKLYEAMLQADVRVVTLPQNHGLARDIGFEVYDTAEKAYQDALSRHGSDARVAFVPYGRYTVLDA
jgi:nickel-dependent lactate racemase